MKRLIYLSAISLLFAITDLVTTMPEAVAQTPIPDPMVLNSRVPVGTVPASSLDFTKVQDFTGNVSVPIPLVSLGGVNVQLKYYSKDIPNQVRTENRYAPSGSFGLGWQLLYGSISAEINGSADTADDRYFYNGPDGSFQLEEGADGVFRTPNYKPWLIQRVMSGAIITGWLITKEDGTVERFGNYYRINNTYTFSLTEDSTYATRFSVGYNGLVTNPASSLYSNLSYIPYQWDLSSIQDIEGDQTTIIYQQVDSCLRSSGNSSSLKYTRESHPSKILDNKGNEIDFNYSPMNPIEFYDSTATYEQSIIDILYLCSINIKGNGQCYEQIAFRYHLGDTLGLGIQKRYLDSLTMEDGSGNPLPSYGFRYCGSADQNPGALKSVSDPQGGKAIYSYTTQLLPGVALSNSSRLAARVDYYDYESDQPLDDGMAGKDFVIVRDTNQTVSAYRVGPTGWYQDASFPIHTAWQCKVYGDYVVACDNDSIYMARRVYSGWQEMNVTSAIESQVSGGTWIIGVDEFGVIGVGPGYFVVKYNGSGSNFWTYHVCIVRITGTGLKVCSCGGTFEDAYLWHGNLIAHVSMRAFCGQNYTAIASLSGAGCVFTHLRYNSAMQNWDTLMFQGDYRGGQDLDIGYPHRIYVGKNFVVCVFATNACNEIGVYRPTANGLVKIDSLGNYNSVGNVVVGDDYYAFSYNPTAIMNMELRTWNGATFSHTLDFRAFSSNAPAFPYEMSLTGSGNRLFVSWNESVEIGQSYFNVLKLGYVKFYPTSPGGGNWSPYRTLIDSISYPETMDMTPGGGMALNGSTFINTWHGAYHAVGILPYMIRAYQLTGNSLTKGTIDSTFTQNANIDPARWICQPGNNFVALTQSNYGAGTDSLCLFTFNELPNGTMNFNGNPTVAVLNQYDLVDGMGQNAVDTCSFGSGVFNQYFTPEYGSVTHTFPGNNGELTSQYYTDKDSSILGGFNYKNLEGMKYDEKEYNNQNNVVNETQNTWTAVGVDTMNGVFNDELLKKIAYVDGVPRTTAYAYEDYAHWFQVSSDTEINSDGTKRITNMLHPSDYSTNPTGDSIVQAIQSMRTTSHVVNAIIEKWVVKDSSGTQSVFSGDITTYKLFGSGQILPQQSMELTAAGPIAAAGFNHSTISNGGYNFSFDSRYMPQITYDIYTPYGQVEQETDATGYHAATKWGYSCNEPVAQIQNAKDAETQTADFEDGMDGLTFPSGQCGTGNITTQYAYTGLSSFIITQTSSGTDTLYTASHLIAVPGKTYSISAMVKSINSVSNPVSLMVNFYGSNGQKLSTSTASSSGMTAPFDWTLFANNVTAPSSAATMAVYFLVATSNYTSVYFDNIRMAPQNALVMTATFDPATLRLTSKTGPDGNPTFYAYDSFQRLASERNYSHATVNRYSYYPAGNSISATNPDSTTVTNIRDAADSSVTKIYTDGLGRTVEREMSEAPAHSSNDLISFTTYDSLGRVSKAYKTFEYSASHNYDPDQNGSINSQASSYYNNNVYDGITDNAPFSIRDYYDSGRLKDLKPEGTAWQSNNYLRYSYLTNGPTDSLNPTYSNGTLNKTATTDENGITRIEFKDNFGNLVETMTDSLGMRLNTKYLHDVMGNLLQSTPPNGSVYKTTYSYNTLNQLTQKTSPDAGTTQYLYDKNGNLRFIMDANHTGSAVNNVNRSTPINIVVPHSADSVFTLYMPGTLTFSAAPVSGSGGSCTVSIKFHSTNTVLTSFTITSTSSKTSSSIYLPMGTYDCYVGTSGTTGAVFSFSYSCLQGYEFIYDKYDSLNRITEEGEYQSSSLNGDFTQTNAYNPAFPTSSTLVTKQYFYDTSSPDPMASGQRNLKGRLSYSLGNHFGSVEVEYSYSYDNMGRVEWIVISEVGWYSKKLTYTYDLQGNVTEKGYVDLQSGSNMYTAYTYDFAGRIMTVSTSPNSNMSPAIRDGAYNYFASGKPSAMYFGNFASGQPQVNYYYNERDWLSVDTSTVFWEHVGYDAIGEIGTKQNANPQWNGDISWLSYYMKVSGINYTTAGWTHTYDNANRLTSALFGYKSGGSWQVTSSYNMPNIGYDGNGNITHIQNRYGSSASSPYDNLIYNPQYGTDRMSSILNTIGDITDNIGYDASGNVTADSYRNIGFVIYDINNLPAAVFPTTSQQEVYCYDVNGNRTEKLVNGTYTFYVNGPNGNTEMVQKGVYNYNYTYNIWGNDNIGQVLVNGGSLGHYYYLKGHLGDVKVIIDANDSLQGYNDYYPFGMQMDSRNGSSSADGRYKYTSKERDAETGYDYFGARYYDSRIGRWMSVDPLANLHGDYSPYAYVFNNPLLLLDPDGRDSIQTATAVADAKDYVLKNPHKNRDLYGPLVEGKDGKMERKAGKKGGPGQPCDCSGLVSHDVKEAGLPDPNHGPKGNRGVQNLVANMSPVLARFARPGNTVFFADSKGDPSHHTGTLTSINVESAVRLTVIQSGVTTGPAEVTFTPGVGKPGSLGATFQGVGSWDTPDLPIYLQTVNADALITK